MSNIGFHVVGCTGFEEAASKLLSSDADCVVIGVPEGETSGDLLRSVDECTAKSLTTLMQSGDFDGKVGTTCILRGVPGLRAARLLLVGVGDLEKLNDRSYRKACVAAAKALASTGRIRSVSWLLATMDGPQNVANPEWQVACAIAAIQDARYSFLDRFPALAASSAEEKGSLGEALEVTFVFEGSVGDAVGVSASRAAAAANGADFARDLGNLPPNVCTPTYLANAARNMAATHGLAIHVLEADEISSLGMGAFLAVAAGSMEPPKLIVLEYRGAALVDAPVVLVGKGITFDAGGISIKPAEAMDEMKFDMCGAATVLGTMQAVAEMKLNLNVVAIMPTCENMPGTGAVRPGDVVKSMAGLTIEVLNTDAEGRLLLCDALTYAKRFNPAAVVDVATLTGAVAMFLGSIRTGLFSPHDALVAELESASSFSGDLAWRLPMDEEYSEGLKSKFADMANIGGRGGGASSAAGFLSKFTEDYPWAHLDIAGTAWSKGDEKGATGRPVRMLTQFLVERAK